MKRIGIVGWKNSGKTGLSTRLIAHFKAEGLRVASLKHAHHSFDIDRQGSDSFRHRAAGADQVLVASDRRWALMTEAPGENGDLDALIARLEPCDLVLVEGWKAADHPKIECHRQKAETDPLLALSDAQICAVASDARPEVPCPVLPLDDTDQIARFIHQELAL